MEIEKLRAKLDAELGGGMIGDDSVMMSKAPDLGPPVAAPGGPPPPPATPAEPAEVDPIEAKRQELIANP